LYRTILTAQAVFDYETIKQEGLKYRVRDIIEMLCDDPYSERFRARALKGPMEGVWSMRINREHRVIYQVLPATGRYAGTVKIIRLCTPYGGPLPPMML
jgi:toxin YoeB